MNAPAKKCKKKKFFFFQEWMRIGRIFKKKGRFHFLISNSTLRDAA